MGYYTRFQMKVISPTFGEVDSSIFPEFDEKNNYAGTVSVQSVIDGSCDSMKWYEHTEDMVEFSKKYPDLIFILDGEGEEAGDIWREFFRNGKTYKWKMPKPNPPEWSKKIEKIMEKE